KSLLVAEQQRARAERALTLIARGEVGIVAGWPNAAEDVDLGRAALNALGAAPDGAWQPPSLSLADRFDTLLELGRRIASALTREGVLTQARCAAVELLRAEHCEIVAVADPHPGDLIERVMKSRRPGTPEDFELPADERRPASAVAAPIL